MLKFLAFAFLFLGCFSLGLALYYGKKNGIIKVFNEVKNLEQKDEFKEVPTDEYGYEDEIYEDVSSEDLRNARMDESDNLSKRRAPISDNKIKDEERTTRQRNPEKTSRVEDTTKDSENETSFMDAETSFMDNRDSESFESEVTDDESTSFMDNNGEEETSFMQVSNNNAMSKEEKDEETSFIITGRENPPFQWWDESPFT